MFKPIPDYPGYFADDNGEIWTTRHIRTSGGISKNPRKLKQFLQGEIRKNGYDGRYYAVYLYGERGKRRFFVHHLVLRVFVGERPPQMCACHGALGKRNNSISNLYWATHTQNMRDKFRDNTAPLGEKNPHHKLNSLQVRIIRNCTRSRFPDGLSHKELGKIFGVSKLTIKDVVSRKRWYHI